MTTASDRSGLTPLDFGGWNPSRYVGELRQGCSDDLGVG